MNLSISIETIGDIDKGIAVLTVMRNAMVGAAQHQAQQTVQAMQQPQVPAQPAPTAPAPVAPAPAPAAPVQPQVPAQTAPAPQPTGQVVQHPASAPADMGASHEQLRQQLTDLGKRLGPRVDEIGQLIQAYGKTQASQLSVEELQAVVAKTQELVNAG